jgi:hypothetical protein
MNERIKEFGLVATQFTNDTVLHLERVHNRDYDFDEIDEIYNQKFAELIVRECIAVHEDDYGVDIIGDVLKKHFGVEE